MQPTDPTALSPGQFNSAPPLANSSTPSSIAPADTNSAVPASTLNTNATTPLTVPTTNNPTPAFVAGVDSGVVSANTQYQNTLAQGDPNAGVPSSSALNTNVSNAQGTVDDTSKQIQDLMTQLGYKNTDVANLQSQYNLPGLTSQLTDLNSQYAQAKSKYDSLYQQTGGQNIPTGFVTGQLAIEHSAAATELGSLAAQIQAAQGNINTANQTIENTINNKYTNIQNQIDNEQKFYDINKANLTTAQTIQAKRQSDILDAKKQQVTTEQANTVQANDALKAQITAGLDPSTGYKAMGDLLSGKISLGDFYKQIGASQPGTTPGGDNSGVVQQTMNLIGATQDMSVSNAITNIGMNKIVAGIIGQEGSSPKGVTNNPGNIKYVGAPGQTDSGVKATDGGTFANYATQQDGQKAVANLVQKAANSGKNLSDFIASYKGVSNTQSNPQYADLLQGKTADQVSAFNSLPPVTQNNIANLLNGTALLSDIVTSKGVAGSNQRQMLLNNAQKLDPTFSENTNKIRYNYNKDWNDATTTVGKTKNSINTALAHLAEVKSDTQALSPTDLQQLNKVKNWWDASTGNANINNLQTALTALATEAATVYKGGTAPSDSEINSWKQSLGTQLTQNQFTGVLNTTAKLLSGKISALNYNYKSTMGTNPPQPVIDPQVRQNLVSAGIDPNAISPDPNTKSSLPTGISEGSVINYQGKNYTVDAQGNMTPQ